MGMPQEHLEDQNDQKEPRKHIVKTLEALEQRVRALEQAEHKRETYEMEQQERE